MRKLNYMPPVLLWMLVALPCVAQGHILPPQSDRSKRAMALELRSLRVEVTIENQLATTKVEHRFFNPGLRWKEGSFFYALPKNAQIRQFHMLINGVPTRAELLDAKEAARIYEDIVRSMRDPAILESVGANLLKARVFPIEAGAEKVITLEYQELLHQDDGLFSYSLPLKALSSQATYPTELTLFLDINSRSPLKTIWSPSHPLDIHKTSSKHATASFESNSPQSFREFELFFSQNDAAMGFDGLSHTDRHGRYFLFNLTPQIQSEAKVPAKDLILVLDTSGSMAGSKLEQAKAALIHCLDQLRPRDRFAIIRFATDAESFASDFRKADRKTKTAAKTFVSEFEALGGTHIKAAFDLVTQLKSPVERPQVVVFLTDGKPTIGTRDNDKLVKIIKAVGGRIFPVGIGTEINTHLLDKLAEATGGKRTYVRNDEDLEFKVSRLFAKIQSPILTDLKLRVKGVRVQQMTPEKLPDLYKGSSLMVMGTYQGHGLARIHLEGLVGSVRKTFRFTHHLAEKNGDHDFIASLWAKRRVGFLLDQIRLHGDSEEVKSEIIRLAKRHGLITPYTSFLILEDKDRRQPGSEQAGNAMPFGGLPRAAKARARKDYEDLHKQSGAHSVAASQELQRMEETESLLTVAEKPATSPVSPHIPAVAIRSGRAFYLVKGIWTDIEVNHGKSTNPIPITFGSEAYFKLLRGFPELGPILSLGRKILFQHREKTYRISDS